MDLLKKSDNLKKEADEALESTQLVKLLSKYGRVVITGSYWYDLLTWRDIDLCLVSEKEPTPELMFRIGSDVSKIGNIASMYYRNELVLKTKGNPRGMFWCIEVKTGKNIWKIDVLVSTEDIIRNVIRPGQQMKESLTQEKRHKVLKIKQALTKDKDYRKSFRSTDIYRAVLKDNVSSMKEWRTWLKKKEKN